MPTLPPLPPLQQALLGIKYVSDDNQDWMNIVQQYNTSHVLMYAPEPKLQSFAIGRQALGRAMAFPTKTRLSL